MLSLIGNRGPNTKAFTSAQAQATPLRSFPLRLLPPHSGELSGLDAAAKAMDRWTGVLHVPLSRSAPLFRVAASLLLSPSKNLAVPRANVVLFTGDRARGTAEPAIERLSDAGNLAGVLARKLAGEDNAWVVDAACFAGPFAVYRELVPAVDACGDPKRYDPNGLPAAVAIAKILSHCVHQIQNVILRSSSKDASASEHIASPLAPSSLPKTIILGFSKGGTVVNQLVTELAHWVSKSAQNSVNVSQSSSSHVTHNPIVPTSSDDVLSSISEFHYVDVGLNCAGAYITDHAVIKAIADHLVITDKIIRFVLHGTPRQWSDSNRTWIRKEKDTMLQLLQDAARRCEGKLLVSEKLYFAGRPPSLLMHFQILDVMEIS